MIEQYRIALEASVEACLVLVHPTRYRAFSEGIDGIDNKQPRGHYESKARPNNDPIDRDPRRDLVVAGRLVLRLIYIVYFGRVDLHLEFETKEASYLGPGKDVVV
jgi:hypothetical protein